MDNCPKCHKETNEKYSDAGVVGIVHNIWMCKNCYLANGHKECRCGRLLMKAWEYCPKCGIKQNG